MPSRRTTSLLPIWWQNTIKTWEIAVAAPQVIAHRTARMMAAGGQPGMNDRREFTRMGQEKIEAFGESLIAMAAPMYKVNREIALLALRHWWKVWATPSLIGGAQPSHIINAYIAFASSLLGGASGKRLQDSLSQAIGKGLAPVHRRATANAKRLNARKR